MSDDLAAIAACAVRRGRRWRRVAMPQSPQRHRPRGRPERASGYNAQRYAVSHDRLYHTAEWRRFRQLILSERPVCQDCDRAPATEPHHVRKASECPERFFDPTNVLALCRGCHAKRTKRGE